MIILLLMIWMMNSELVFGKLCFSLLYIFVLLVVSFLIFMMISLFGGVFW